eukprot:767012-Hanusia_phi.AAC.4
MRFTEKEEEEPAPKLFSLDYNAVRLLELHLTCPEPRTIAFPNGNGTISEMQTQIQTMSINKSSLKPKGGVGIAFSDRINMESRQREFYVQKIFPDGPAAASGLVSFNDVLIEVSAQLPPCAVRCERTPQVNGEKVSNWDIWTLSQRIPGPVDSPVLLRMKSGVGAWKTTAGIEILLQPLGIQNMTLRSSEEDKQDEVSITVHSEPSSPPAAAERRFKGA